LFWTLNPFAGLVLYKSTLPKEKVVGVKLTGGVFAAGLLPRLARKAESKIARVANNATRAILEIITISSSV